MFVAAKPKRLAAKVWRKKVKNVDVIKLWPLFIVPVLKSEPPPELNFQRSSYGSY